MKKEDVLKKIEEITFPILHYEGRTLTLAKDGWMVGSYDPVYSLDILEDGQLEVEGFMHNLYRHKLDEFDDIMVEEFALDKEGDRVDKDSNLRYNN